MSNNSKSQVREPMSPLTKTKRAFFVLAADDAVVGLKKYHAMSKATPRTQRRTHRIQGVQTAERWTVPILRGSHPADHVIF